MQRSGGASTSARALRSMFSTTPLAQLGGRLAEQLARDDQQMDLLRALEDVEDLRVARPLLDQLGLAVAGGAAEAHAAQRDVGGAAAGLRLGHRSLERVRLSVVGHPCGL